MGERRTLASMRAMFAFRPVVIGVAVLGLSACATGPSADSPSVTSPSNSGADASATDAARTGGAGMAPERDGQPTVGDLAWLVGAWRQDEIGPVTSWEVWRRTETGLVAEAWQASRGISRQTERLELELTLDGWVLTPVFFDEFERPERSDPFPLAAWGRGWARFENPEHATPHTIAYRRTPSGLEAWLVSERESDPPKKTVFRFVAMEE